jgi:hypothetical protein
VHLFNVLLNAIRPSECFWTFLAGKPDGSHVLYFVVMHHAGSEGKGLAAGGAWKPGFLNTVVIPLMAAKVLTPRKSLITG